MGKVWGDNSSYGALGGDNSSHDPKSLVLFKLLTQSCDR